jgi:hypothetical protein
MTATVTLAHVNARLQDGNIDEQDEYVRARLRGIRAYNRVANPAYYADAGLMSEVALHFADDTGTLTIVFATTPSHGSRAALPSVELLMRKYAEDEEYIIELNTNFINAKRSCDNERESKYYGNFLQLLTNFQCAPY